MPNSCCAKITPATRTATTQVTFTNQTSIFACIPSDFVAYNRLVETSSLARTFYDCPYSTSTNPAMQGGNMSDPCPNGASDACAGMSHSCCATHKATVSNVEQTKINQICIDKAYAANWQIQGPSAGAQIKYEISCLPPVNYPVTSFSSTLKMSLIMLPALLFIIL